MMIRNTFLLVNVCGLIFSTSTLSFANAQADLARYDDMLLKQHVNNRKFSSDEWKRGKSDRAAMLYDLVHSVPLIGMSGSQIESLLGKPLWQTEKCAFFSLNDVSEKEVFQLDFENGVVYKYAVGFHFCRGFSCNHLSKWHVEPKSITSTNKKATFLDANIWEQLETGAPIGLSGGIALLEDCLTRPSNTPFELIRWKNGAGSERYKMLYDLVHSHKLVGLSRSEVSELLGSVKRIDAKNANLAMNENLPKLDSIDRYPVLFFGRGGCINRPYIVFDVGYHNDVAVGFRVYVEPNRTPMPTCWENMGHWQSTNLAVLPKP